MGLRTYVIRRLLLLIPTLLGVTLLIFAIMQMFSPATRAFVMVQNPEKINVQDLPALIEKLGLNDPFYVQYFNWISQVLAGNLGWSNSLDQPVAIAMISRAPASFELVIFSAPIIILLGIYLGVKSAIHQDKAIDHLTRTVSIIGWSLPTFWAAIVLLAIFYAWLGWFPAERLDPYLQSFVLSPSSAWIKYTGLYTIDGLLNGRVDITLNALRHLVLPVVTLTIISIALIIRVMRSSMLEALHSGYVISARAKGLDEDEVINKHARRNALIPTITISGLLVAGMLNGVVITETVFTFNGLGFFAASAALQLDIAAILGFALFTGVIFVLTNLIVDILYAFIDPRIRLD